MMRRSNRPPMRSVRDELSSAWDAPSAPDAQGLTNKPAPKPMAMGAMQGGQVRPPAFGGAPPPGALTGGPNVFGPPGMRPAGGVGGQGPSQADIMAHMQQSAQQGQMPGMSMPTRPGPGAPPPDGPGDWGGPGTPNPQAMQGQAQAMQGAMGQMQPPQGMPPAGPPGTMAAPGGAPQQAS